MTELAPLQPGDLNIDVSPEGRAIRQVRAHKITISKEERAQLGPLGNIESQLNNRPFGIDLLTQIVHLLRTEDSLAGAQGLLAARKAYEVLIRGGYAHEQFLADVNETIALLYKKYRKEFIRRLMLGLIPDDKAQEVLAVLDEQIETGRWPEVQQDMDQVADELSREAARECA